MKKVISTRLDSEHLAKAIDGLKAKGYKPEQLNNISAIVRLTFYYGLASLGMADQQESTESNEWIERNLRQGRQNKNITLGDIK